MQPDERTPAVCLAPQTTMQAGSRLNVFSSCHHNHWISDALIVDDLDGRLVACQSVNSTSVQSVLEKYVVAQEWKTRGNLMVNYWRRRSVSR